LVLADALTSDLDTLRNGVVLLLDMNGLNSSNFSFELEKVFITAFQEAYPLRIKHFIIVNAPLLVRGVINCAKPFMKAKMRERIVSVKTGNALWNLVDKSQVPSCAGGTFDENKDGSYPTTAWQFVVSKSTGDLPDLTVKGNKPKTGKSSNPVDPVLIDDDDEWMRQKRTPKQAQNQNIPSSTMMDHFVPSESISDLKPQSSAEYSVSTQAIIHSVDAALEVKTATNQEKRNENDTAETVQEQ